MTSKTATAQAVKWALFATSGLNLISPAWAADTGADQLERIEVTGSRIKRVDMETTSPVTVITSADIQMSGQTSVEDVLNTVSANSFGSWKAKSGYGAGYSATNNVDLRGLGATLVLLDGRRLPSTGGSGGTEQDVSAIPLAIVDRIEILRDGASAIYGSDAVAGVVNIITKKQVDGVNLAYQVSSPKIKGGLEKKYEFSAGATGDKGSVVFVAQHSDQNEVTDADVSGYDNGVSSYSPVALAESRDGSQSYYASELCTQVPNTVERSGYCGYAYSNVTWLYGSSTKDSALTNVSYELSDNVLFKGQVFAGKTTTWTRYAPTPVSTNDIVMAADNPLNPLYGEEALVSLRTGTLGNRDTKYSSTNFQYVGALEGTLDLGNGIDWNLGYQHNDQAETTHNYNLIKDSVIQDAIDDGRLDLFNVQQQSYEDWLAGVNGIFQEANHTGIWEADQKRDIFDGSLSSELFSSGDVSLNAMVGTEFETLDFWQKSDPESALVAISGGSGGDDVDASRDRNSYFSEFVLALPYRVEIDAAIRYDKYDLSGIVDGANTSSSFSGTSPKLGILWRPTDDLLLRANWGKAFRAPAMTELYASSSISFDSALDPVYCTSGVSDDYCASSQQHKTYYASNQDLQPEESEQVTAGFVWNITQDLAWETTYWNIDYKNKIESLDIETILSEEASNGGSSRVVRGADGKIASITTSYVNLSQFKLDGLDMSLNYLMATGLGDFKFNLDASWIHKYEKAADAEGDAIDYAGEIEYPDLRGNLGVQWSQGDYAAGLTFNYIGKQTDTLYGGYYLTQDHYVNTNLTFAYSTAWNGKLTLGVANLFDVSPEVEVSGAYRNVNDALYDVQGRTLQLRYEQSF
ncbi:TonB-dependent receptor [Gallaecimonas xiamenensis]|uniref:TonB-dependent receptor n=1 Tax=Gallaecimonas xiamenensis 3-C-1 TaxID=745411 RepID=K2JDW1_9GAMM|nr:TonB-dependent receptor [Gallaecimonas xiamenensis]EKE68749.1 TonB-dependent receptor [Gallaecimonas xiamenensis 3-C-1]